MKIEWTALAIRGKQNVADYIRNRFGYKRKRVFIQEVDRTARMLLDHPNLGPVEPLLADMPKTYRSVIINGLSKIIYFIGDDVIYIVDFWDVRREPKALSEEVK